MTPGDQALVWSLTSSEVDFSHLPATCKRAGWPGVLAVKMLANTCRLSIMGAVRVTSRQRAVNK